MNINYWLTEALKNTNEYMDVKPKRNENEEIIGKASLQSKKLYTLWQQSRRRVEELLIRLEYDTLEEETETNVKHLKDITTYQTDALEALFWFSCRYDVEEWQFKNNRFEISVGIRKNYEIVELQDDHDCMHDHDECEHD